MSTELDFRPHCIFKRKITFETLNPIIRKHVLVERENWTQSCDCAKQLMNINRNKTISVRILQEMFL